MVIGVCQRQREEDDDLIAGAVDALRRAGRSVAEPASHADRGGLVWLVTGHNGEDRDGDGAKPPVRDVCRRQVRWDGSEACLFSY